MKISIVDNQNMKLFQGDVNQYLKLEDCPDGKQVQFYDSKSNHTMDVKIQDGGLCPIPNQYLDGSYEGVIKFYIYSDDKTIAEGSFEIKPRQLPSGYMYEPTMVQTYEAIIQEMKDLLDGCETESSKAQSFASAASTSEANAKTSETNAKSSEDEAKAAEEAVALMKTSVEASKSDIESEIAQAKTDISTSKADALSSVATAKKDAVDTIATDKKDATDTIAADKATSLSNISEAKADALSAIASDKANAIGEIVQDTTSALTAIQDQEATSVQSVKDSESEALTAVQAQQVTSVEAVQAQEESSEAVLQAYEERVDTATEQAEQSATNASTSEGKAKEYAEQAENYRNEINPDNFYTKSEVDTKFTDAEDKLKDNVTIAVDSQNSRKYIVSFYGTEVATFTIPYDKFLKSATFDSSTNNLVLVFFTESGTESTTEIPLSTLVDTYTQGNGIDISNHVVSLKIKSGESILKVDEDGAYTDVSALNPNIALSIVDGAINITYTK